MTDAAFLGTFSDFKLVKGRGVAVFCIEVPLEKAGDALEMMGGLPMPAESRWVGVARVNPSAASSNGRTPDFDSGNAGSTPAAASTTSAIPAGDEGEAVTSRAAHNAASPSTDQVKRQWRELPLSQRAAILCQDELFWRYLWEARDCPGIKDKEGADRALKWLLAIESKRELDNPHCRAARDYLDLESLFLSYKGRGEHLREYGA